MNLIPTEKAGDVTLEAFRARGWADMQLIEHGYFVAEVEIVVTPAALQEAARESVWRDMRPAKTAEARPVVRNPFGVTDLAQVQAVYDEARHAARSAPGGWSFEAQLLEFAIQLCKGK